MILWAKMSTPSPTRSRGCRCCCCWRPGAAKPWDLSCRCQRCHGAAIEVVCIGLHENLLMTRMTDHARKAELILRGISSMIFIVTSNRQEFSIRTPMIRRSQSEGGLPWYIPSEMIVANHSCCEWGISAKPANCSACCDLTVCNLADSAFGEMIHPGGG